MFSSRCRLRVRAGAVATGMAALALVTGCTSSSTTAGPGSRPSGASDTPRESAALHAMLPANVIKSGTISSAISLAYEPMEWTNPGSSQLMGVDIQLARDVAAKLGVTVTFQNYPFEELIPAATSGRADMIWTAITDLTSRQSSLNFVDYFRTGDQFFIPSSQQSSIKTVADLCGKTVVVATGTAWIQVVQRISAQVCTSGKRISEVEVPDLAEELLQMQEGRAQACMVGLEGVGDLIHTHPGQYASIGKLYDPAFYGVAFSKNNSQLQKAVLAALQSLMTDGTYQKVLSSYGVSSSVVSAFTVNHGVMES